MKITEYEGFDITLNEHGFFSAANENWSASEDTLEELKRKISEHVKRITKVKKIKVEPFTIIRVSRRGDSFTRVRVTSFAEFKYSAYHFWISGDDKRSKETLGDSTFVDCPENEAILTKMCYLKKQIESLSKTLIKEDPVARAKQMGYEEAKSI